MNTDHKQMRTAVIAAAVILAILVIILLNALPLPPKMARFLVDKDEATHAVNLWAAQNAMWIAFFWGLAELFLRHASTARQEEELSMHYLPEDASSVLLMKDMPKIHQLVRQSGRSGMLAELVCLISSQFQSTGSVSMCNDIMNTSLELKQHEIDLHYNPVRYISWLIPSLGFIGTVYGILQALDKAKSMKMDDPQMLSSVIGSLSVAFWTTLLSLLMSCCLMLMTHLVQTREERLLNRSSRYCVNNLINRLLER